MPSTTTRPNSPRSNTPSGSSASGRPTYRFKETQRFPLRRVGVVLAVPPTCLLILLVWQVVLGHPFGSQPWSNANVIGWTIFLWIIYFRLITVRLVTEVSNGQLTVKMRGLWRSRRIPLSEIRSAEIVSFDPLRDYGGYGIRSTRRGAAYITSGNVGVRLALTNGEKVLVGSQRAEELAKAIQAK